MAHGIFRVLWINCFCNLRILFWPLVFASVTIYFVAVGDSFVVVGPELRNTHLHVCVYIYTHILYMCVCVCVNWMLELLKLLLVGVKSLVKNVQVLIKLNLYGWWGLRIWDTAAAANRRRRKGFGLLKRMRSSSHISLLMAMAVGALSLNLLVHYIFHLSLHISIYMCVHVCIHRLLLYGPSGRTDHPK